MKAEYSQHKIISVWIPNYLYKYLKATEDFTDRHELIVKGSILIPPSGNRDKSRPINYFSRSAGKTNLKILSRQSGIDKLYALMRYYKRCFYRDMINYTAARHNIIPYQTAIREFLRNIDIYESDYSTEAAYKKWQRSREYQKLKGTSIFSGQGNIQNYMRIKELLEHEQHQQRLHG